MTDPIADMLTRIRNAAAVKKAELFVPYSKVKMMIAEILKEEGYVDTVETVEDGTFKQIKISLKYNDRNSVISHIKRISKPGLRVYRKAHELPRVLNGMGIAIVSTSQGLMTNKKAVEKKVGGEILCEIY